MMAASSMWNLTEIYQNPFWVEFQIIILNEQLQKKTGYYSVVCKLKKVITVIHLSQAATFLFQLF